MANPPVSSNQDEIARSISEAAPIHYILKIQSFSLLAKSGIEKYESGEFEACGYKWKLVLHPNGNKSRNVKEHLSCYLSFADVIPIRTFTDASNGYLVEDTCVFGAEVFVTKEVSYGKGECLSMIKDAITSKHVWKIENFSKLDQSQSHQYHESQEFFAGDHTWKIQLYPQGRRHGTGSHISLYLSLADVASLTATKIYAEFTLRIQDQQHGRHIAGKVSHWFSASSHESGWAKFASLGYFHHSGTGCLVKDICIVEAELTVHALANTLS
ncbi:TRAF-like family protein [Corchorus olitorius]|uniref:TRAF-like family protein n=1 Tax=Corchorus olitorius TaxID=93759 RepID=A0A1R3GKC5_9ROSI|nr:TRAF-like family protein [Corchorus olitorius]